MPSVEFSEEIIEAFSTELPLEEVLEPLPARSLDSRSQPQLSRSSSLKWYRSCSLHLQACLLGHVSSLRTVLN